MSETQVTYTRLLLALCGFFAVGLLGGWMLCDALAEYKGAAYTAYQSDQISKARAIFIEEHDRRTAVEARLAECERERSIMQATAVAHEFRAEAVEWKHFNGDGLILHRLGVLLASCETIHGDCSAEGVWTFAMFRPDGTAWEVSGKTLAELVGGAP